jgi:hypothetical protein
MALLKALFYELRLFKVKTSSDDACALFYKIYFSWIIKLHIKIWFCSLSKPAPLSSLHTHVTSNQPKPCHLPLILDLTCHDPAFAQQQVILLFIHTSMQSLWNRCRHANTSLHFSPSNNPQEDGAHQLLRCPLALCRLREIPKFLHGRHKRLCAVPARPFISWPHACLDSAVDDEGDRKHGR